MNISLLKTVNRKKAADKLAAGIKQLFIKLTEGGFESLFKQIDQLNVKKGVDTLGIDKFINQCALLAAGSGAITGIGGLGSALLGVPLDVANLITQQFRVSMALSYHHTGRYKVTFAEFIRIVATSMKVDTGISVTKTLMEEVAAKMMISIGSKTAERLIPVVGAAIGGTANYLLIKKISRNLAQTYAIKISV